MTTTRQDIIELAILPAIASGDFGQDTTERIIDAIFEAAPLSTWSLDGTEYVSTAIDIDGFWSIVEETATARTAEIIEINREVGDQHFDLVLVRDGSEVVAEVWVESSEESEPYDAAVAQYGPLTWLQNSL